MAPIRRYLRISAYSVLEVRIYLDNPADAHRWLLQSSDPALPRIIQAVRPFVLPKLREENERSKKGGKKKGVKDVVHADDFEVSIFLTELSTPHAILTRAKIFGNGLGDGGEGSRTKPLEVGDEGVPGLRREETDEDGHIDISDIPMEGATDGKADQPVEIADSDEDEEPAFQTQGHGLRKGTRRTMTMEPTEDSDSDNEETSREKRAKRKTAKNPQNEDGGDDKKKLGFRTNYEGFRIHGRILCLVVKRKSSKRGQVSTDNTGQAMLENWIASTQDNPAMLDE